MNTRIDHERGIVTVGDGQPAPSKPTRSARAALNYIGKLLKARGWSKHSRAGLKRRRELRPQRRKLLAQTFSRTLMKRLHGVTGASNT